MDEIRFADPQRGSGRHTRVPATRPVPLPSGPALDLDDWSVAGLGRRYDLPDWLGATYATSLVLVAGGRVRHEWYAAPHGPATLRLGASMTKSVLGHLVGLAVASAALRLDDRVTDHVGELAGSGWDGCVVEDLLTMTSGTEWLEDHRDPGGPAARLVGCFLGEAPRSSRALLAEVGAGVPPGTRWAYSTADSQVLDWVRESATGEPFAAALAGLWAATGAEADAAVAIDAYGVAMAGGGLAATTRDWARVGRLAVTGEVDGRRVLAPDWVAAAGVPAYGFTAPGRLPVTISSCLGFGRHWWPLGPGGRRLAADGSRGQLAYVDLDADVVVVRTSAWPHADPWLDRACRDLSYLGLQQLARSVIESEEHP